MFKRTVLMMAVAFWLAAAAPQARSADSTHGGHADPGHSQHDVSKAAADAGSASSVAGGHGNPAGGHGAGHEPAPLIPDFSKRETQLQSLWVVIIFIVLLMILYPTAWRNILAGLKKREERIRGDIAEAEAARKRAEATLAQYNQQLATAEGQVRDILAKAQADAERIATSMKMQAQQEAEEAKERATRDIDAARKAAVADIYAQAADLSTTIAEKILRRNINAADQRELVEASLQQLQSAGKV